MLLRLTSHPGVSYVQFTSLLTETTTVVTEPICLISVLGVRTRRYDRCGRPSLFRVDQV